MIELALKAGGPDNVTVIIADVVDVDYGDDVAIVGGAAGDGSSDQPPPDSPASRAGAITAPRTPPPQPMAQVAPTPDPKARNRKRVRLLVWIVAVLIVLGLGAGGTVWWVLGQYYVGATDDNHVAIFEGVRGGPVLGIPLHRVAESSCLDPSKPNCPSLTLDELQESAREDVSKGVIPEKPGMDGAREAVRRLWLGALLPVCTDPATTGTSSTTTTTTTSGAPTSSSGAAGGATATSSTSTAPTLTSAPQQPGKNCRKVG